MNRLDTKDRAHILHLLKSGESIRSTARIVGTSKNTISKLLIDAGRACAKFHAENVRNVSAIRILCNEIWSFADAKQKSIVPVNVAPEIARDTWTWIALDADSKLIVSYLVGARDSEYAMAFMNDIASRLTNRVQMMTDFHKVYLEAVEGTLGCDVDYAQLVKIYGNPPDTMKGRYLPAGCVEIEDEPEFKDDENRFLEGKNLTMRMHMRRFTRPTNAFSKKVENYVNAVALHSMYYNFMKIHSSPRMTPAMAAGVSDRLWEIDDIVALITADEAKQPPMRGSYKKRVQISA